MKEYIEQIMTQLNGKTFHSTEQVNVFFRESLESVAEKQKSEIVQVLESIKEKDRYETDELIDSENYGWNSCRDEIINKIKEI